MTKEELNVEEVKVTAKNIGRKQSPSTFRGLKRSGTYSSNNSVGEAIITSTSIKHVKTTVMAGMKKSNSMQR